MNIRKRTKWEPAALMVLVLGLGLWIAFGPASKPKFPTASDAITQEVRIGNTRGAFEAAKSIGTGGDYGFRVWIKDGPTPKVMSRPEAESLVSKAIVDETIQSGNNRVFRNWAFRALNITTWTNMVWIGIGLLGQVAFSGRMILQWMVSEKHRKSVITESFWWFSLFGGITLFSYFVWRADPVGILGQASGIVIYVRNIRLLRKHARREVRDAQRAV
jgi:lipid-A-disaccharide synthase-like uncharacterized protein